MTGNQRGSLAAQLRPRLILTVAVMAVLLGVATVFAARTILYNQLDGELDAAQVRQGRGIVGGDRVPGIETPGMRAGTVITLLRGDGTALKGMVGDGAVMDISDTITVMQQGQVLVEGPPDAIRNNDRVRAAYLGNMITGGKA